MDQCFPGDHQPIVIIRNKGDSENRNFYQSSGRPVYLLETNENDNLQKYRDRDEKRYSVELADAKPLPVTKFILETYNANTLQLLLHKLKDSTFWNVEGFFVIKSQTIYNSCQYAYDLLKSVWEFNILNAVLSCHDLNDGLTLYSFNPYGTTVPESWTQVGNYHQSNGHPFTMYKHILKTDG